MKLKELCTITNTRYNKQHPSRSYDKIKQNYIVEKNGNQYTLIREMTEEEKEYAKTFSDCKNYLQNVILLTLNQSEDNLVIGNIKELLYLFNLVNNNYKKFTYNNITEDKIKIAEQYNTDVNILHEFYGEVNPILTIMIKQVLYNLQDMQLINIQENMMFNKINHIKNVEITKHIIPTTAQIEKVMDIRKRLMNSMGYQHWSKVKYYDKININMQVCKELNIDYIYNEYKIILNKQGINKEADKLKKLQKLLNISVATKILKSQSGSLKLLDNELKQNCINAIIKNY